VERSLVAPQPAPPGGRRPPRRAILGLPLDVVGMPEVLAWLAARIEQRRTDLGAGAVRAAQVVTLNPEMAMAAQQDTALRRAIVAAELVVPDGMGIVWAAGLGERVSGVDLLVAFAEQAAARDYGLYLLGAAPGVAEAAARRLLERWPRLRIVGAASGSPGAAELDGIAARVRAARADAVFVAFGTPAQERWIAAARPTLGVAVAIGVGGALDFVAGRVPRAPDWMRARGLEWLYRLLRQPWRWRRMLALPRFVLAVAAERRRARRAVRVRE